MTKGTTFDYFFQKGDKVRILNKLSPYYLECGTIVDITANVAAIKLENYIYATVNVCHLEKM